MRTGLTIMGMALLLSGCQLLDNTNKSPQTNKQVPTISLESEICLLDTFVQPLQYNCDIGFWISFWTQVNDEPWLSRKLKIDELGEDVESRLKKILLSQGPDTPYQDRLRAQNWSEQLFPQFTIRMQQILMTLIYQPSQQILEFESALAILTRINASQSSELEAQRSQLLEQQQQLEQLLKIEASLMESREGNKP